MDGLSVSIHPTAHDGDIGAHAAAWRVARRTDSPHYRYFKPQRVYFEACAAGKLLLMEPSAEQLERQDIAARVIAKTGDIPHDTQRYWFVAMNVIAECMCELA